MQHQAVENTHLSHKNLTATSNLNPKMEAILTHPGQDNPQGISYSKNVS